MSESPASKFILSAGNFFFRYRNALFPAVFFFVFVMSAPIPRSPFADAFEALGVALVVAGQAFRLAVIGFAYIKRGGKDGKVFAEKLVVRGFYAHTRNPMYVGNGLIVLGLSLAYQSVWSLGVALPFFLSAYYAIVAAEERYLRAQFGEEYEAYARRVNRFIPDFRGLRASLSEFRYDWKRAIRKDYGNIAFAALALLAIGAREGLDRVWLFRGLFVTGAFYFAARFLKKSGRLASPNT